MANVFCQNEQNVFYQNTVVTNFELLLHTERKQMKCSLLRQF